jgi:hypothetical protein
LQQQPDAQVGHGAAAALDFLRSLEIAPGVPLRMITHDVTLRPYLDTLADVVRSGALLDAVHAAL